MFFISKRKFENEMFRRLEEIRDRDNSRRWNSERFDQVDRHLGDLERRIYRLEKNAGLAEEEHRCCNCTPKTF